MQVHPTLRPHRAARADARKLTDLKPYRETTLDQNGEMQHESLISTAGNENTHRRLAVYSGRGRGEELATGSMVAGDYIASHDAAIRHDLPSCGADVKPCV